VLASLRAALLAWGRRLPARARTDAALAGALSASLGLLLGLVVTSPAGSMGVNWDTAGYASEIARGSPWARTPWNSHYGVGQVYWLAAHLGRPLGLTVLGSLRALNALALALSALVIALAAARMRLRPLPAVLLAAVYLTGWGTLLLAFTWEDNILFHPFALAALALCLVRIDEWRWRQSLAAGVLAGLASLMSWQGAAFALPAIYASLVLASAPTTWWRRLRDAALVPAGLVLARFAWAALYWLTTRQLDFAGLVKTAFERPTPNFLPQHLAGWWALLGRWRELLAHLGLGVTHELGPGVRDRVTSVPHQMAVGSTFVVLVFAAWLLVAVVLRRRFSQRSRFLVASLLLLTLSAAVYLDLPADKYKRYDYLPMVTSLGLLVVAAWAQARATSTRWHRHLVTFGLVALVGGQVALAVHWNRQWYARLATTPAGRRIGNGGQTWFAWARSFRRAAPAACSFIFAYHEVAGAKDNLEILAALVSELPEPKVIDAPPTALGWPRPLPLATPAELAARWRGCEWVSASARPRLPVK
jgi:4-amino-4-deoxy-L-arabinose transferase-like glycosyltransferase